MIKIIHNDGKETELEQYIIMGFDKNPQPDEQVKFSTIHETKNYGDAMAILSIGLEKFIKTQKIPLNDFILALARGINQVRQLEISELEKDLFPNSPKKPW